RITLLENKTLLSPKPHNKLPPQLNGAGSVTVGTIVTLNVSVVHAGILSMITGNAGRWALICSCIFFSPFFLIILVHSAAASFIASLTDLPPVIAACRFLSRASYSARVPGKFIVGADRMIVSLITGTWYAWYVSMTRGSLRFASCHGSK